MLRERRRSACPWRRPVQYDINAVPGKVFEILRREFLLSSCFSLRTVTTRTFFAFSSSGSRVRYRAGGSTAEIPGHRYSPKLERTGSRTLRQDQGRPAGPKYHGLGVPLIVRFRYRHDREITKPRIFDQKVRDLERLAFLQDRIRGKRRTFPWLRRTLRSSLAHFVGSWQLLRR